LLKRLTAAVPDMKDVYSLGLNREQNPILVGWVAVKQLPHLKREDWALGS
jgi:hypothetical protein